MNVTNNEIWGNDMLSISKMRNDIANNFYFPLVFIGIIQMFVTSEIFSIIGFIYLVILIFKDHLIIRKGYTNGVHILLIIFFFGLLLGIGNIGNRAYLRDIYYYLNPMIYIYMGIYLGNDKDGFVKVLNSVVAVSVIVSLICLINMIMGILRGLSIISTRSFFDIAIWGNVFSILILLIRSNQKTFNNKSSVFLLIFLLIICFLGISRTVLIQLIVTILIVVFHSQKSLRNLIKLIGILMIIVAAIIVLVQIAPNNIINSFLSKSLNSFNEISANNYWSQTEIQENWRGYEMNCAQEQFLSEGIIGQLFGHGFGTGVYVGEYAKLVHQSGNYIYVLHNGFFCILVKLGIIGLLLYIFFYISIIWKSFKNFRIRKNQNEVLIIGTIMCLIVYTYLVKGIFSDFVQFNALLIIGGWMGWHNSPDCL